ncbi:MAG: membrane protein insertase YidC [Streptosporangiaceae bacterium]
MSGFLGAPTGAAYHVVFAIAQFLAPLPAGLATAAAIVIFTVAVRLLLFPLSYHAFRGQATMTAVGVRAQELRSRHVSQPDRLQRELADLYRQEGTGLLAGCLPLLLQLPFFSIMYRLFLSRTVAGRPNGLLARELLGTPLGSHWLTGAGPASAQGILFLGLFALLAAVAFLTARAARAAAPAQAPASQPPAVTALSRVAPYGTLIVAAFVPLAAGVYLLTTTGWTVGERVFWRRRLGQTGSPTSLGAGPPAGSARAGVTRRRGGGAAPTAVTGRSASAGNRPALPRSATRPGRTRGGSRPVPPGIPRSG